ncbi:LysR family transcriptional regulator [Photobacterium jeanii]|uniref:LysR family transcriptional regulator n=1 Tax=Photobacterium jeanii TaxID=858640 RepID=A0A178K8X1_9GAMM|nr:LysR family transcriptional regulator [Photobacterium jeanii]OAN13113.1 LysR family transcriptional regulator [Photobacterium jeanii]PST89263.1 LysR family transcriptional regulator [Photobacterium jeanii]
MKKRHAMLPSSLNGLRVFETAARHLSFTLTADELNVTQSAVSRQIKQLEEQLGITLFIREHRALSLTDEGKSLSELLTRQFSELNGHLDQLKNQDDNTLRLNVAMSLAVRWLIPRLHSFKEQQPDIDIVLSSIIGNTSDEVSLNSDEYDIAIYNYEQKPQDPRPSTFLRFEMLAPVYSALISADKTPLPLEEALCFPLLHPTKDRSDWRNWLAYSGINFTHQDNGLTFDTLDMALTSCMAGQGIAMTDLLLVVDELEKGFLQLPQPATIIEGPWRYAYVCQNNSRVTRTFIEWLEQQVRQEQAQFFALAQRKNWQIQPREQN